MCEAESSSPPLLRTLELLSEAVAESSWSMFRPFGEASLSSSRSLEGFASVRATCTKQLGLIIEMSIECSSYRIGRHHR